jgi:hypothetical protein
VSEDWRCFPLCSPVKSFENAFCVPIYWGKHIAIGNKCGKREFRFLATFVLMRSRKSVVWTDSRQGEDKMKQIVPFIVAAALGAGVTSAAQAHVSVGIGIGVPVYSAPPVVYAPPTPVIYQPPPQPVIYAAPPPVVYAAPPVVVGGYYGRPYWGGGYRGGYYRGGYGGWRH